MFKKSFLVLLGTIVITLFSFTTLSDYKTYNGIGLKEYKPGTYTHNTVYTDSTEQAIVIEGLYQQVNTFNNEIYLVPEAKALFGNKLLLVVPRMTLTDAQWKDLYTMINNYELEHREKR